MFKVLVLQALYNLSDEQTEYQILDRTSFLRFLALELHDDVPDARTIWAFREQLIAAGAVEKLFEKFDAMLNSAGFAASGGQIVDATFVEVPRQRNPRDDNATLKKGETPADWSEKKKAHKDTDARWTKKNNTSFYGYKNHVNIDRKHKLIRRYTVTDASVHDSQRFDSLLNRANTSSEVYADSAYRSADAERKLKARGFRSRVHERGHRNRPLTQAQIDANRRKSRIRVRIEHVFGAQENAAGGRLVRTIGMVRAKLKIGLQNLAYNIRRLVFLERTAAA